MPRRPHPRLALALLASSVIAACGDDSGSADAGPRAEAGPSDDAGPLEDAGPPADAGPSEEDGGTRDGGEEDRDAGREGRDAGADDAGPPEEDAGGEDGGPPSMDAGPPPTDGGPPATDAGPPATDAGPPATDAGAPAVDAGAPDAGAPDAGTPACDSWLVTYDLDGSQFDIRATPFGAGDATLDIGPGTMVIRFPDVGGAPGRGPVSMISYRMVMDFEVARVDTDIVVTAGPDECGIAEGRRTATGITWSTPMRGYHSVGTVTCNAAPLTCRLGGFEMGVPRMIDETHDQALERFVYVSPTSWTMDWVEVPNDDPGDTFLRFEATETRRTCVVAPDCP